MPKEEICVECAMRDQDMADVDVTSPGIWRRDSDVDFEDLLQRELEDEAAGIIPQSPQAQEAREDDADSVNGDGLDDDSPMDDINDNDPGLLAAEPSREALSISHQENSDTLSSVTPSPDHASRSAMDIEAQKIPQAKVSGLC